MRLFLSLLVIGAGWLGFGSNATATELAFTFEENTDPRRASDSSGNDMHFPYLGKSGQSVETAKFGTGSMALGPDAAMGFEESLAGPPFSDLGGPISQMTISLWVLPTSEDVDRAPAFFLQRLNGSKPGGFTFSRSASGQLMFYMGVEREGKVESAKVSSKPTTEMNGEWTHFAMTFNEGEVSFYYNGEPLGTPQIMPDGLTSVPALLELRIGVLRGFVSSPGIANVDEFAFLAERALTPDEIAAVYEKGLKDGGLSRAQP